MADYYYAELLFDPNQHAFLDIVDQTSKIMIDSGCTFREIIIPRQKFDSKIKWGDFSTAGMDQLREMCSMAEQEGIQNQSNLISFPPGWGRIMYEYHFKFDERLNDEIWDEEEETNALSTDVGLSFTYTPFSELDRYIKLTICLWEDFVLKHGSPETHIANLRSVIGFFNNISQAISPFFGVMNNELHINADKSLELLRQGRLPEGNEYVLVGKTLLGMLDPAALTASGRHAGSLKDGSIIIEFTDRWAPASAL